MIGWLRSVAMTLPTLYGRAAEIAATHRNVSSLYDLLGTTAARVAGLAADDPDAPEAGRLMSALLDLGTVSGLLSDVVRQLSEATHECHTRLDR